MGWGGGGGDTQPALASENIKNTSYLSGYAQIKAIALPREFLKELSSLWVTRALIDASSPVPLQIINHHLTTLGHDTVHNMMSACIYSGPLL